MLLLYMNETFRVSDNASRTHRKSLASATTVQITTTGKGEEKHITPEQISYVT